MVGLATKIRNIAIVQRTGADLCASTRRADFTVHLKRIAKKMVYAISTRDTACAHWVTLEETAAFPSELGNPVLPIPV